MSVEIIMKCDRCRVKFENKRTGFLIYDRDLYIHTKMPRELDLCDSCYKKFNEFIDGGE